MRLYYVFVIDNSLSYNEIKYKEEVISCHADTLMPTLRHGQRDVDVFILFDDKGILESTLHSLDYYFTKYFWKVWEDKSYNTLYCRQKWAKANKKVMLASDQATSPELCKVWWHGCYNLPDAMGYKLDDVGNTMYITEMTAHSIVDYWEDKVCCLKASFSKKIREIDYDIAENICNNRENWYKKYVIGDVRDAEFAQILFREELIDEFSLKEINKIMDIIKNHTSLKDKYRYYYFKKTEEGLDSSSIHTLFWFNKDRMEIHLQDRVLNKKNINKIIKHYERKTTTVCIYPNES